jgi:hypothetical protein
MGKNENAYRIMLDEPERRRPLGRPTRRWEGDIKNWFERSTMGMCRLDLTGSG